MSRTISAGIGLLFLFVFVVLFGLTGCEKIVTVTEIQRDTVTEIHTDTLIFRDGHAMVRFVSMLPNRSEANILLYRGSSQSLSTFGDASDQPRSVYIPVKDSTAFWVHSSFRVDGSPCVDSFELKPLPAASIITCALFQQFDGQRYRLIPKLIWDSMKVIPPRENMAYLRLINALADYPSPNNCVNLKLKSMDSSTLFVDKICYQNTGNYIEVPAGTYPVYVTNPEEPSALYEQSYVFSPGGYYTAMLVGQKAKGTDKLVISAEN